jgi:hypothetical protein
MLLAVFAEVAPAQSLTTELEAFNHSPAFGPASDDLSPDENLLRYYQGMSFVCRNDLDSSPKENADAAQALRAFLDYSTAGDQEENFWFDAEHKQKLEDLLAAAVKAGSWKATYLDSLWAIKFPSKAKSAEAASAALRKQAQEGIPIALYKYSTYLFGRDDDSMYRLLSEAIERGSPQAMASAGGIIVMQSRPMWPLGKALLECSASHGYADAYGSLGVLADMQGRRLDAYRLWEQGANGGCRNCLVQMSVLATVRKGYTPATPMEDLTPELERIKAFYQENFFYQISELPDTYRRLPKEMEFHPSDTELLRLLERQKMLRTEN